MTKKDENKEAESRIGFDYDPTLDSTEGGVVKVKDRKGKMVAVPPDTKSLADVVSGGKPAPSGGAPATTAMSAATTRHAVGSTSGKASDAGGQS